MSISKFLAAIFLYQIITVNFTFAAEIENKENIEHLSLSDLKKAIKNGFHKYTKEEIKFILLKTLGEFLHSMQHPEEESVSKEDQNLIEDLQNATTKNNYEKVVDILTKTQVNPHTVIQEMCMSPFLDALCHNHIDIVKLFIWHSGYNFKQLAFFHNIFLNDFVTQSEEYKQLIDFMQNYAPKISRIKSEDMITTINEFLAYKINDTQKLPTVLNELIYTYFPFYPTNLSDQVKLTNQEIDEIIELYDSQFSSNEYYKKTMKEIEEEFTHRKPEDVKRTLTVVELFYV